MKAQVEQTWPAIPRLPLCQTFCLVVGFPSSASLVYVPLETCLNMLNSSKQLSSEADDPYPLIDQKI